MKKKIINYVLIILVIAFFNCGKKLPPSSPDRWAPHLLNVSAVDEHHLSVFFSESIDTVSPRKLENFILFNPQSDDTIDIILSERTPKGDEIVLTIQKLVDAQYTLTVLNISDIKGNVLKKAEKSFEPSHEKDTIPPIIRRTYPSRVLTSAPIDSLIFIEFSEPMDSVDCSLNNFILTNISIDTNFIWNETITKLNLRYELIGDRLCKLFILPLVTDLSGNFLENMRVITLTSVDSLPKNRMDIGIVKGTENLIDVYAFLTLKGKGLLEDIVAVDTSFSFSFYSIYPDTYVVSVAGRDSSDTTGLWWGEKETVFIPDSVGSMGDNIEIDFIDKGNIPDRYIYLYKILRENLK